MGDVKVRWFFPLFSMIGRIRPFRPWLSFLCRHHLNSFYISIQEWVPKEEMKMNIHLWVLSISLIWRGGSWQMKCLFHFLCSLYLYWHTSHTHTSKKCFLLNHSSIIDWPASSSKAPSSRRFDWEHNYFPQRQSKCTKIPLCLVPSYIPNKLWAHLRIFSLDSLSLHQTTAPILALFE